MVRAWGGGGGKLLVISTTIKAARWKNSNQETECYKSRVTAQVKWNRKIKSTFYPQYRALFPLLHNVLFGCCRLYVWKGQGKK